MNIVEHMNVFKSHFCINSKVVGYIIPDGEMFDSVNGIEWNRYDVALVLSNGVLWVHRNDAKVEKIPDATEKMLTKKFMELTIKNF